MTAPADYTHCKFVTGTTSMCYNGYKQRSFLALTNDRRDVAIEELRDDLTTKYAQLIYSDVPSTTGLTLTHPNAGNTVDKPGVQAVNIFQTLTSNNNTVYTPPTVHTPPFQLRDNGDTADGGAMIKFVGVRPQQVEISGEIVLMLAGGNTDNRIPVISIYVNDELVDTQLRTVGQIDSSGDDAQSTTMTVKFMTSLNTNDKVKFIAWGIDGSGGNTEVYSVTYAKLYVGTIP